MGLTVKKAFSTKVESAVSLCEGSEISIHCPLTLSVFLFTLTHTQLINDGIESMQT